MYIYIYIYIVKLPQFAIVSRYPVMSWPMIVAFPAKSGLAKGWAAVRDLSHPGKGLGALR